MSFSSVLEKRKDLNLLISESHSLTEVTRKLGYSDNGRYTKALREYCTTNNISISHFTPNGIPLLEVVEATCPQCSVVFIRKINSAKVTCSHSCGNKYFAYKQGTKNKTSGVGIYRSIITKFYISNNWEIKCLCCTENTVLDVHHIDEDRNNNNIDNLAFLCPTHHAYLHRLNDSLVYEQLLNYLEQIKNVGRVALCKDTGRYTSL